MKDPAHPSVLRSKLVWVASLYFSEGFPLGICYDIFPVGFGQRGIELRSIGIISLLGLAWTLNFLWAPAIDQYRRHRLWMAAADLLMGTVMLAFALSAGLLFVALILLLIGILPTSGKCREQVFQEAD